MFSYLSYSVQWTEQFFSDLNLLLDRVHGFFEQMGAARSAKVDADSLQQAKLVTHEWLANLIQHANFGDRTPEVSINVQLEGVRVRYVIKDNSQGFDLQAWLKVQERKLTSLPERGMGLLMIRACTDTLSYERIDEHHHCLVFSVPQEGRPHLEIPLEIAA